MYEEYIISDYILILVSCGYIFVDFVLTHVTVSEIQQYYLFYLIIILLFVHVLYIYIYNMHFTICIALCEWVWLGGCFLRQVGGCTSCSFGISPMTTCAKCKMMGSKSYFIIQIIS